MGFEDQIVLERKSLTDSLACVGRGGSLVQALRKDGGIHPNSLIGNIAAWAMRISAADSVCRKPKLGRDADRASAGEGGQICKREQ
jgi:hypothetical protein